MPSGSLADIESCADLQNRPLNMIVHLNVPDSVIMARIAGKLSFSTLIPSWDPSSIWLQKKVYQLRTLARWVHLPSGRVYNTTYSAPKVPGIDDVTGEPLSKRPDDTPVSGPLTLRPAFSKRIAYGSPFAGRALNIQETFTKRLSAYYESTAPLLQVRVCSL
jgi:adenylate kinase family enzyme